MSYYWNVEKSKVEEGPSERGFAETRLGPFETSGEAEQALATLHKRNAEQDAADEKWRNG